jgi:hypothetical protein
MLHKLLLTAGFALFLSTFASSNECARNTHHGEAKPAQPARSTQSIQPAQPAKSAAAQTATADTESSTLIINKLLYI